ncbi:disintegrin and metalloproteinase domain-containing protein 10-like isoform X2 [Gigantopelta aegis]|uniref:disintegrin and metalloproteinase domain-containing protein 10-like isoform X2 n=1 Tax=Gigantopelta aegis TaxID=1735272 RepID=UPI001B888292|nr:disintegrin and metalloproteinase domain-containing protein 10-like isoform X2 [Gigantopelta aegis]
MKMSQWLKISLTICVLLIQWIKPSEQEPLDDYILDYQEVNYDPFNLHNNHMRVKRSLDKHLYLRFKAYDRDFHLKLQTAKDIFSPTHMMEDQDGNLKPVDTSFIYEGSLVDVPRSFVHVAIINGTARGHIHIPGDTTYHIEPSKRFFHNPGFHSVIYPERHMNLDPYRHLREKDVHMGQCGNDRVREWMTRVSESAYEAPNRAKRSEMPSDSTSSFKYTEQANRHKRSVNLAKENKNTCYLYLRTDPTFWNFIKKEKYKKSSADGDLSDERVTEEIQAFFASHVNAVKTIFSDTLFESYDRKISYSGITFLVQRTKIMTDVTEKCTTNSPTAYCNRNIDVSNFLNLNSMDNHDDFCLAYVFAHRDFTQGTLGLAWVASPSKKAGGICEKSKRFPAGNKHVWKSLNTGIVTIVNYGKSVPSRVSQLTFAHECGHNFGSPHDSGIHCAPFGTSDPGASKGNYIMFASATMGDKDHNDNFSPCSQDNITRVLDAMYRGYSGKSNCLSESQGQFCGNGITEEGEECDCGFKEDCTDTCCHPKGAENKQECKLKSVNGNKVQCSPTQGPCCKGNTCTYVESSPQQQCRAKDECSLAQYCNGQSSSCPVSDFLPNMTRCNANSQVCISGKCMGSVCQTIPGWSACYLTSLPDGGGPSKEELCYVACMNPSTKKCVSSFNKDDVDKPENDDFKKMLSNISVNGIKLPAGSPCDKFRGYCDVFHLCRGVDADGPLARLKNLIFNPQTLQTIKDWIVEHWWAVMLMSICLVVVMGVFIKVCAVHTPSSNPRKRAARKLSLPGRGHRAANNKAQDRARQGEPPPPYTRSSAGGPAHGKGPRYNKDRRNQMELQQRI